MASSLETWALPRLQQLLPLDDDSLKQVITYTDSLPKDSAAEHLKNLLGDDAKSLEFISSFNLRRQNAPASSKAQTSTPQSQANSAGQAPANTDVPRGGRRPQKKKANIHALPARQLEGRGNVSGGYQKGAVEDYVPGSSRERQKHKDQVADNLALTQNPEATQMPLITDDATLTAQPITSKPPPSASGPLISDTLGVPVKVERIEEHVSSNVRGNQAAMRTVEPKIDVVPWRSIFHFDRNKEGTLSRKQNSSAKASAQSSRTSSPAPKPAKVNISGGTAMHGASTALSDLDSAIRSLEIQTNPSLATTSAADTERRKCNCMATRHPLLDMAPNCQSCGKIICVKEGLGPCTFCGSQLLSADEIQKVLRILKDERGEVRMKVNNAAHKRADVAQGKAKAYTGRDFLAQASSARSSPLSSQPTTPAGSDDEASAKAKAHRDKLLGFQANNARRTQIHDEAADYDLPSAGTNMWASPEERARQLKKQQKILREMEWNAKPEYEKRRVVASIDLKGGKVVRRMADVEKPDFDVEEQNDEGSDYQPPVSTSGGGAFSNNPLASGLIRPTAREGKGKEVARVETSTWRRVQMDEDNEQWILDGGVYGGHPVDNPLGEEEHPCG